MQSLLNKKIVLGISGGIAAYKTPELARLLMQEGASVQVIMTDAAQQFVTPVTMQALSGNPVYTSQWDNSISNNMAHIELSRAADAIVIAPGSADLMAKLSLQALACDPYQLHHKPEIRLLGQVMLRHLCLIAPRFFG